MPNGRLEKETVEYKKVELMLEDMPDVCSEYYYAMRSEKKSYRTIKDYIKVVRTFIAFCEVSKKENKFYKRISQADINKFLISIESKTVRGETVSTSSGNRVRNWYALNSFFEFLIDAGYIAKNPIPKKTRPKYDDKKSVTYLTEEEVKSVMQNIKENAKETFVNRDLCIFAIGVTTGLRIAAITQINIEDVDFQNGVIHVIEKRNKTVDVIISDSVKTLITKWIADRRRFFPEAKTNALFVSQLNERISYDAVRKFMLKYSNGATLKHVTPHVMRHTCATNLYEKTGDIYLCATQLNHSSVTTTQRYAAISDRTKQKAANILGGMIE